MAGDLNLKKSWNPALVKNQRKVWDEEQAKLDEFKKIKQRNEELVKEQEYVNLLKLQYGDDFEESDLSKNERLKLSKLNWMYSDQPSTTVNSSGFNEVSSEFVEGKKKVEQLLTGSKSLATNLTSNMNKVINVGKSVPTKSLTDDPLAIIRRQQVSQSSRSRYDSEKSRSDHRRSESDKNGADKSSHRHRKHRRDGSSREHHGKDRVEKPRSHRERHHRDKNGSRDSRERDDEKKRAVTEVDGKQPSINY